MEYKIEKQNEEVKEYLFIDMNLAKEHKEECANLIEKWVSDISDGKMQLKLKFLDGGIKILKYDQPSFSELSIKNIDSSFVVHLRFKQDRLKISNK